jgi:hypothetical protein
MTINDATESRKNALAIWWGNSAVEPLVADVLQQLQSTKSTATLIPASLVHDDPAARLIRNAARVLGMRTRVVTPRWPLSAVVGIVGGGDNWREVRVGAGSVRIDSRVLQGPRIGLVPISLDYRQGPFPLDLASRFLHPVDRARFLIARNRDRMAADIASGSQPDCWIITTIVGRDRLWLTTTDIIAAELWSLALAERFYDAALEAQGPWEDPTLQRATELELGVRIPAEMQLRHGVPGDMPDDIAALIATGCQRLGMDSTASSSSGEN